MRKMRLLYVFFFIFIFMTESFGQEVKDKDNDGINDEITKIQATQSDAIDYVGIQTALEESMELSYEVDFQTIVTKILKGEYDFDKQSIGSIIAEELFEDLKSNIGIILRIIIICIAAAIFKTFAESFENKQVAEVGFFIVFLLIMTSILQSYNLINSLADDLINKLITFIEALVPSLLAVTALSGATISSFMYSESILMLIGIINNIIKGGLLPFLYIILVFVVMNTLTDESHIGKFIELFKKIYEWSIKIILWLFVAVFGLQSFGLPVADGLITKTAKQTISIVPIVGSTLSEVSDFVLGCGSLIKNAFGIGAIISILLITIIPILKITAIALIYKLSAAFIEPISDKRITNCLSDVGDVCFLLLGTVLMIVFLFIAAITITLYLTNIMLYIR